ncbi:MAG: GWxTD domain-containing protein [Candidatus Cloacimonetes bacterium]|nr:GWxTD domain-containing protein [Candidatus Cloacimonadota bacterium]
MKKYIFTLVFFINLSLLFAAGALGVYVDDNRYLAEGGNTRLEINYSLPYFTLDFMQGQYGYEAEIFVDISVKMGDKLISSDSFTNKVIIRDAQKMFSDEAYLDKITITLPAYQFLIDVDFTDTHTENTYHWSNNFIPLDKEGMFSDLELSTSIMPDTTSFLAKFHRQDHLYQVKPSHTYSTNQGQIFFFEEFYNLFEDEQGNYQVALDIEFIKDQSVIDTVRFNFSAPWQNVNEVSDKIDISGYEEGYYDLHITCTDKVIDITETRDDFLLLKTERLKLNRFFPEIEDDFMLAGYFFNSNQDNTWKNLSPEGKKNYLDRFWQSYDPNPATEENEFLVEVAQRIDYANDNFSHFKPGWTSDMGRIYIKYGQPYEISKLTTNLGENDFSDFKEYDINERKHAYDFNKHAIKNYQIWKYRLKKNANYIFIDMMTSGDYKLIYSSDDEDGENGLPDWRKYLGYDFDDRLLD